MEMTKVSKVNSKFPTLEKKWSSLPDSLENNVSEKKCLFVCCNSNITKAHWQPDEDNPKCYGCQITFTVVIRRHHCRRCGNVFCGNCSCFKMQLDDNAVGGNGGKSHRVCFHCVKYRDGIDCGQTLSLFRTFSILREAARPPNQLATKKHSSNTFQHEAMELCGSALDIYLMESKQKNTNLVSRVLEGAIQATIRESNCSDCGNDIIMPKNRKQCVVCNAVFCKKCSCKELIIFSLMAKSRDNPIIAIVNDFKTFRKTHENSGQYRICLTCRDKIKPMVAKADFHEQLDKIQRSMSNLQFQIIEALKQKDNGVNIRTLQINEIDDTSIEMNSLVGNEAGSGEMDIEVLNDEKEIMKVGSRISTTLMEEFFKEYQALLNLTPCTEPQDKLLSGFKQAMCAYYNQTKPEILKPLQ